MPNFVMARAFRGQPLCRLVVSIGNGLIYICNPARLGAVQNGDSIPVGFPAADVFVFEEEVFRRLREQWDAERATDPALWALAEPYRDPGADRPVTRVAG